MLCSWLSQIVSLSTILKPSNFSWHQNTRHFGQLKYLIIHSCTIQNFSALSSFQADTVSTMDSLIISPKFWVVLGSLFELSLAGAVCPLAAPLHLALVGTVWPSTVRPFSPTHSFLAAQEVETSLCKSRFTRPAQGAARCLAEVVRLSAVRLSESWPFFSNSSTVSEEE